MALLCFHFALQVLIPFSFITLSPSNLFWTEQGYRFSWRVMLMEKSGLFGGKQTLKQNQTWEVNNYDFGSQTKKNDVNSADMILQFAHC